MEQPYWWSKRFTVSLRPINYIYALVKTSTNECVYVGITRNLDARLSCHKHSTVKDIRDDCHMIILECGHDINSVQEAFWIDYMDFIGCELRNKRKRTVGNPCAYFGYQSQYAMPHLLNDMNELNVTTEQLAKATGLTFSHITRIRHGEAVSTNHAYRIRIAMCLGVNAFCHMTKGERQAVYHGSTTTLKRMVTIGNKRALNNRRGE